jgi:hypothetical protein
MSRHPVLTWTLRALRAAQLAMLLCFVAYFVCVQVNAVAYLTGSRHPLITGTVPPVSLDSAIAAAADITTGLILEAFTALIVFIVIALASPAVRSRRRVFHRR